MKTLYSISILREYSRLVFLSAGIALGTAGTVAAAADPGAKGGIESSALRPAEQMFVRKAVALSRQQVRLAQLAASQAHDSAVRSHAQQLITDYRSLADALESLSRRKGGAGGTTADTSEAVRPLAEKTGPQFDREYVRLAGQLSDEAQKLFEQFTSEAKDPDVRALAAAQLPVFRAHYTSMTELRKTFD